MIRENAKPVHQFLVRVDGELKPWCPFCKKVIEDKKQCGYCGIHFKEERHV